MRVGILAHLLSFAPGYRRAGVSRYIEALARALPVVEPDIEPVLFIDRREWQRGRDQLGGVCWVPVRFPTRRPLARIAWEQAVAPLALRRHRLDIVHAPVNVVPLLASLPSLVTVHDLAFLRYPEHYPPFKQRYLAALTRRSVRRARLVIAVSEQTRADVIEYCRVDPAKVCVVPNGVDAAMRPVRDPGALDEFRQARDLPEEFILFLGTVQPRKNVQGLLRAYALVREDVSMPLVIAGARGWLESPVFRLVGELGLTDRVRFAGYVDPDELALWYSAATVFVYPSLYEGFGLPVLEAMACGTPVVTSAVSALPEVAGDAAVLIDPHDPTDLARALREVVASPALRERLAAAGLERARAFSWERTARETALAYRRVTGQRPAFAAATERRS